MTVFFFCPKLRQPGINLREDLDSVNPTYFQSAVRMQSFTPRWRVTARSEFNGLHYRLAQTIIMTEMEMFFSFWEWGSDHAENGEIKGGGVQIVYIDSRKKSVTLRGSVSFGFEGLEDKPLRETDDISNAQWYSSQKSPVFCLSCVECESHFFSPLSSIRWMKFACYNTKPNVSDITSVWVFIKKYPCTLCWRKKDAYIQLIW